MFNYLSCRLVYEIGRIVFDPPPITSRGATVRQAPLTLPVASLFAELYQ